MATANERFPMPANPGPMSLERVFRAAEAATCMTILGAADRGKCPLCGAAPVFFAHCFREAARPVIAACRSCLIDRAGSEEALWIKTTAREAAQMWRETGLNRG